MRTADLVECLDGIRPNGSCWKARCPDHDDREASLSIHEGGDGRVLLKCFAGCETSDIVAALGLSMRDLMPEGPKQSNRHQPAKRTRYEIREADGQHVATHVWIEHSDGSKRFAWEQPDGSSGLGGLRTARLPLYGIDRLNDHAGAILNEGEKATDALLRSVFRPWEP
jgi:hypothetical protein